MGRPGIEKEAPSIVAIRGLPTQEVGLTSNNEAKAISLLETAKKSLDSSQRSLIDRIDDMFVEKRRHVYAVSVQRSPST